MAEPVNLQNTRGEAQRKVMEQIIHDDQCPFCPEALRLQQYHKQPIIRESEHWVLTPSQYPYPSTKAHLLAILKVHATTLAELPKGAGDDLLALFQWAEQEFGASSGGAFILRFGKTECSGATIPHLHAQFAVPDNDAPDYKRPRFSIGRKE
jgi:ATP adenylyltransferase